MMKNLRARLQAIVGRIVWGAVVGALLLSSQASFAQYNRETRGGDDPETYERKTNPVSAGGNWTKYSAEDRMTAAKRTWYQLPAKDASNSNEGAKVIIACADGNLTLADFHPDLRLARPNWISGWTGRPQMRVRVRVDNEHSEHGWNWVRGRFLAMDKGTTRELIGAHLFRIEFLTPDGQQIAEFSPAGLDLKSVKQDCGLTPKKP